MSSEHHASLYVCILTPCGVCDLLFRRSQAFYVFRIDVLLSFSSEALLLSANSHFLFHFDEAIHTSSFGPLYPNQLYPNYAPAAALWQQTMASVVANLWYQI